MKDGSLKQGTRALLEMLEDGIFLELRDRIYKREK